MDFYRTKLIFLLTILSVHSVVGVTITNGGYLAIPDSGGGLILRGGNAKISEGNTQITLNNEYNIFTDGNLYIDYSVFSDTRDLSIGAKVSLIGQTVTAYSFDQEALLPDLSLVSIFRNPNTSMNEIGDILIFSEHPILSGVFEASGNIYIGNYSAVKSVPLPTSLFLFISGLAMLGRKRYRR